MEEVRNFKRTGICIVMILLGAALGIFAVYKVSASEYSPGSEFTVHFFNSDNWANPYIYYYTDGYEGGGWPGSAMTAEDDSGWYAFTIKDYSSMKVIFSDMGSSQNPGAGQEGYIVTKDAWYCNGNWYDSRPECTTVHYYNSANWNQVNLYYYQDGLGNPSWPGVIMTNETGKWFSYSIWGFDSPYVIFSNNGGNQNPGAGESGYHISGEMWYKDGVWYDSYPLDVKVHFYKPEDWGEPYLYYYVTDSDTGPAWPGSAMTDEGDGWYEFHVEGYIEVKVLFNDILNQIPGVGESGFYVSGAMWYKDGSWYRYKPCSPEEETVTGDINGDGVVDEYDKELLEAYINGDTDVDEGRLKAADVNGDGIIDEEDTRIIEQFLGGEIDEFPVGSGTAISQDVTYEYDKLGRVTKAIYDGNNYIEYVYDANGNITDVKVTGNVGE